MAFTNCSQRYAAPQLHQLILQLFTISWRFQMGLKERCEGSTNEAKASPSTAQALGASCFGSFKTSRLQILDRRKQL